MSSGANLLAPAFSFGTTMQNNGGLQRRQKIHDAARLVPNKGISQNDTYQSENFLGYKKFDMWHVKQTHSFPPTIVTTSTPPPKSLPPLLSLPYILDDARRPCKRKTLVFNSVQVR